MSDEEFAVWLAEYRLLLPQMSREQVAKVIRSLDEESPKDPSIEQTRPEPAPAVPYSSPAGVAEIP